ncbi:hypothetical protein GDO86_019743 [Hymenochirus boettgeri]|uniref:Uncharacterized protein n=1 Tax=Hymenochirus boettgeri TaxID=247094 RepID=A0A8T2IFY5_9PIPI|nr:hypothetical protein GDO86_019743 [Hymenochirus boettgeri]
MDKNMKFEDEVKKLIQKHKMVNMANSKNSVENRLGFSQATFKDYENSKFKRAFLNPYRHHFNEIGGEATFTLTNVVPMTTTLHQLWSSRDDFMVVTAEKCDKMYVVTGVVPGNTGIENGRVTVPSHVWSAYCCVDVRGNPTLSGATIKENKDYDITKDKAERVEIIELERKLKELFKVSDAITIFPGTCSIAGPSRP